MNTKLKTLTDLYFKKNLAEANIVLDEILKEKIYQRLKRQKEVVAKDMFEGETKDINKKHKNQIATRIGSNMGKALTKKSSGRLALRNFPKPILDTLSKKKESLA